METLQGSRTQRKEAPNQRADPRKTNVKLGNDKLLYRTSSQSDMVNHFQESKVQINKSQTSHDVRRNFMKSNICFGDDKCDYSRESDNLKNHQKLPPLPK